MKIEFEITRSHLIACAISAALIMALNVSANDEQPPALSAAAAPALPTTAGRTTLPAAGNAAGSALAPATAPVLPTAVTQQPAAPALPAPPAPETTQPAPAPAVAPVRAPSNEATARTAKPRVKRRISPEAAELASIDVPPLNPVARDALRRSNAWASNEAASVDGATDGRVIFTFGETMPTIVCAPLRVCDVELQPGEKVLGTPNVGDNVRWDISPGHSGSGPDAQTHVIIKPHQAGLDTNLVISTDRRTYHLRLVSDPTNYVSDVAFSYPSDDKKAWDAEIAAVDAKQSDVIATMPPLTADKLNFNFTVKATSGAPEWVPVRVFDDGAHTYIQMPKGMAATEAPVLVLLDDSGHEQLVNYRLRGDYFVIDRVIDKAALEAGVGRSRARVEIRRSVCTKRGFFGSCKN